MILSFFFFFFLVVVWRIQAGSRNEVAHAREPNKKKQNKKQTNDELPRKMRKMGQKEMVATKYSREKRRE